MKRDWTSQTGILLAGGILVVVNLIGLNVFGRLDWTDDRVYSLSQASQDLVAGLEDPVTITAYFADDLPPQLAPTRRFLKDKLDDYRAYGGQNVQYKFVDPSDNEELQQEASRNGIPSVQVQVVEKDNVQLKNAYMGVALQYADQRESIPVIQDLSRLEYDLTSAIRRLTRPEKPVAAFLTGHGEPDPTTDMRTIYQELGLNYLVTTYSAADLAGADRPDVLIVVAPTDTIPEADLRALDEYLMSGGRLGLLLNRVGADLQVGQAAELNIGLQTLLDTYGVSLLPNLIMDEKSSVVTMQRQQGIFNISQQIEYPLLPVAENFDSENPMVNRLQSVRFYFVSSIDTTLAIPDGVTMQPLVWSSSRSGVQQGFFMLAPTNTTASLAGGPYVLAASYTGTFPSAFDPGQTGLPARLVVVGDGDFINETVMGSSPDNIAFGLNIVDWLAQDEAYLAIRTKSIAPRALQEVSDGIRPVIKYANMVGPLLVVLLFGLSRWRKRRGRQIVVLQGGPARTRADAVHHGTYHT